MAAAFTARGLVKRYGTVTALGGVDLDVEEGELVGLLGPNGAGKSTLVKIGCGLVRATSGEAHVRRPRRLTAARGSMGYLAELFRFLGGRPRTAPAPPPAPRRLGRRRRRAHRAARPGRPRRRPNSSAEAMSKGMQQRLGIAQALVGTPRFLFLDEPTSALDPRQADRAPALEELRHRGVAVLLNSHLLSEIELVCDRVAILSRGSIVAEGRPSDLARPRGVEVDVDGETRIFEGAGRDEVPGSSPGSSQPASRSTASASSRRRSRRSTSRRSGTRSDERYPRRDGLRRPREPAPASLPRRARVDGGFLGLYALGAKEAFDSVEAQRAGDVFDVDERELTGATMFGLSMFGTLFRRRARCLPHAGDRARGRRAGPAATARGQAHRPLGDLLAGRFAAAAAVCAVYVVLVFVGALLITRGIGGWTPDRIVGPALQLACHGGDRSTLTARLDLFSATANGIAVFMVFGAGLVAGLLGQIGEALDSRR